jgi:mycothiol synthase
VVAAYRSAFGDARVIDEEEIVSWLRNTELNPDWLRVLEVDGRIAGYGDLWLAGDEVAVDVAAPGHWRVFLEWAEETAREQGAARVRVASYAGEELAEALESRGYRFWRSAYTMRLDLGETAPEGSPLPPGIDLRSFTAGDQDAVRIALNEAFEGDPFFHKVSPAHFREFYLRAQGFDPSLWLLAWDAGELAGFVLAFPKRSGDTALGWVQSLGVRPQWRRRGIGEALLRVAIGRLHARGLRAVGLGVQADNATGALGLYERVGMRPVSRIDNWVLDLG